MSTGLKQGSFGGASAAGAALAANFTCVAAAVVLTVLSGTRDWPDLVAPEMWAYALAIAAIAFAARCVNPLLRRRELTVGRALSWDLIVFVIALGIIGVLAVPSDASGAALFGLVTWSIVGLPLVIVSSIGSCFVRRNSAFEWFLRGALALSVLGLLISLAMQLR